MRYISVRRTALKISIMIPVFHEFPVLPLVL